MSGTRTADCGLRRLPVAALLLLPLFTASAPQRLSAQRVSREFGVQGYGLLADEGRIGGGVFGALRVGPRARLSLVAGGEGGGGGVEGLVHLLLAPAKRRGAGAYVAGGLAADVADRTEAWIVALVGVEGTPGGGQGWVIEAGVGGGVRVVAGWRWRR